MYKLIICKYLMLLTITISTCPNAEQQAQLNNRNLCLQVFSCLKLKKAKKYFSCLFGALKDARVLFSAGILKFPLTKNSHKKSWMAIQFVQNLNVT